MNQHLRRRPTNPLPVIAVVIPCYHVASSIGKVLDAIGPEAGRIYCVDDFSTDETAAVIAQHARADSRVRLVRRPANGGVGAAVLDGYRAAVADGARVIVKIDGDGQMDPAFIAEFARPILEGKADYVKGNRFFSMRTVTSMPAVRLFGNAALSFASKLSSGYWNLFDPTNGYTAIHADIAALLPFDKIHCRYFFESDVLFRLSILRASIDELPMEAVYGGETSNLSVARCLLTFPALHLRNLVKRIIYNYFVRNFSVASLNLLFGLAAFLFGMVFGLSRWAEVLQTGQPATAGTVMLSALPMMIGIQLLLNFLAYDMSMMPTEALHNRIARGRVLRSRPIPTELSEA